MSNSELLNEARRARLLRECKEARGFPESLAAGLIEPGPKIKTAHNKRGPASAERRTEMRAKVLQVNRRRDAGMTRRAACRDVCIGEQTYADWANALNIQCSHLAMKGGPKYSAEHVADIRKKVMAVNQLRLDGVKSRPASKTIGLPYNTYRRWASQLKIEFKKTRTK